MSTSEAKQRLMAIDVGEVSLVDRPANEVPFVVTKSVDGKAPSHPENMMNELQTAIEALQTEVTKAKGKKMPPEMMERMKSLMEVMKGLLDEGVEVDTAKVLDSAIETVAKAGKAQFSKERMAKLNEMFGMVGGILKEVDADGFGKMVSQWTPAPAQKQDPVPTVGAQVDAPPAWFNSAIEGLKKDVEATVTGKLDPVAKRLETVEKATAESKALPQNGTDNAASAVKKSDSIWKGVL